MASEHSYSKLNLQGRPIRLGEHGWWRPSWSESKQLLVWPETLPKPGRGVSQAVHMLQVSG